MAKYMIQGIIAADCALGHVEAASAQEAITKAWDELETGSPNICHQCSQHMNVGDIYKLVAQNVDDDKDYLEGE